MKNNNLFLTAFFCLGLVTPLSNVYAGDDLDLDDLEMLDDVEIKDLNIETNQGFTSTLFSLAKLSKLKTDQTIEENPKTALGTSIVTFLVSTALIEGRLPSKLVGIPLCFASLYSLYKSGKTLYSGTE